MNYVDCDRCGKRLNIEPQVLESHVKFENGLLCMSCVKKRTFDGENPVLYPKGT